MASDMLGEQTQGNVQGTQDVRQQGSRQPKGVVGGAILAIASLTVTCCSIAPALNKLIEVYPEVPMTTIMYIVSLPTLCSVISTIIAGIVVPRYFRFKPWCLVCTIMWVILGILPTFIQGFAFLLASRCVFALFMGGLVPLVNPLVNGLYSESRQARMLSLATFFSYGSGIVLQYTTGILADINWPLMFLTHLWGIIAVILICFLEEPVYEERPKVTRGVISKKIVTIACLLGILYLFIMPVLLEYPILVGRITSSVTVAATVQFFYTLGSAVGGLCYALFSKFFKRATIGVACLISVVGQFMVLFAPNIPMMCVGMLITGFGFGMPTPAILRICGLVTKPEHVAFCTMVIMAFGNTMSFVGTPFVAAVAAITGDAVNTPIIIAAIIIAAMGVGCLIKSPFPKDAFAATDEEL